MKMRMRMMKTVELAMVLCCVLGVSADDLHENLNVLGCSDSDGEFMYTVDGEEVWYADFEKKEGVEPQPSFFAQHITIPGGYQSAEVNLQICKANLGNSRVGMKDIPQELDPPSSMMLYSRDEVEEGKQNILICHVTGFYPAPVKVQWTKNGDAVTAGVSINVPFPNKDGSYRQASRLDFVPQLGDTYSCSVHHSALEEPMTKMWEVEVQLPSVGPSVFCGLGLTLGLVGVATGTFFLIKGNECS